MQASVLTITRVAVALSNGPISVDDLMVATGYSRNTVRLMVSRLRTQHGCDIKFFNGTYRAIDLYPILGLKSEDTVSCHQ